MTSSFSHRKKHVGELSERLIGSENSLTCSLLFLLQKEKKEGKKDKDSDKEDEESGKDKDRDGDEK